MADACVYLMENIEFTNIIDSKSLRGGTTKQPHQTSTNAHDEVRNTHINIGTGKEISIKALAELIANKIGFTGELIFNTSKPVGTPRKLTDVTKLHALGWHHQIEIEEGIKKVYQWYVNQKR